MVQNSDLGHPGTSLLLNHDEIIASLKEQLHKDADAQMQSPKREFCKESARMANIEILSQNKAKEMTILQGQILETMIKDIQKNGGSNKKSYVAEHYGKDVAPGVASNYCLVVQMQSLNLANKKLGKQVSEELASIDEELNSHNILQIKTRNQDIDNELREGVADSLSLGVNFRNRDFMNKFADSPYMDNVAVNPHVERTGYADFRIHGQPCSYNCKLKDYNVSLSSYIDETGHVKKDKDGKPMLKDGDFAFVQTNHGNENSSGFHAIRLNVDEDGKVTYTAGNSERIKANLSYKFMNAPCAVFHTQDYIADCVREEYKDLNYEQSYVLTSNLYHDQVVSAYSATDNQELQSKQEPITTEKQVQEPITTERQEQEPIVAERQTIEDNPPAPSRELSAAEKVLALRQGRTISYAQQSQTPGKPTYQGFSLDQFHRLKDGRYA